MVASLNILFSFLLQLCLCHGIVVRIFAELFLGGQNFVNISRTESVGEGLSYGLTFVLYNLHCRNLHMLVFTSLLPFVELVVCERRIGDELCPEHPLVLPVLQPEPHIGPGLHDVVDLGGLAHVRDLCYAVHGDAASLVVLTNANANKASNNGSFKDWKMNKLVKFESGQTNLLKIFTTFDSLCLFDNFFGLVSLCIRFSRGYA